MTYLRRQSIVTLFFTILTCLALLSPDVTAAQAKHYIVRDGKPMSVIMYGDSPRHKPNPWEVQAAKQLQQIIKRATGVQLRIIKARNLTKVPKDYSVIMIGGGSLSYWWGGLSLDQIDPGAYRIISKPFTRNGITRQFLFLQGRVTLSSANKMAVRSGSVPRLNNAMLWAVGYFLDHYMGVKWLWPGKVGTYVPPTDTIVMPTDVAITKRPKLVARGMRDALKRVDPNSKLNEGMDLWAAYHHLGSRSKYHFGHSFTTWWNKYHKKYPGIFAKLPKGYKQPYPTASRVKLDLANETVDKLVIKEWKAAGAPDVWNVCPNDGRGWSIGKASLAMDKPALYKSWKEVWGAPPPHGILSARMVHFWSRLLGKMRKINPNVELCSYAYSAYSLAPPAQVKIPKGLVLAVVPSGFDAKAKKAWANWGNRGAKLMLRPNWLNSGGPAPYLPLHKVGSFLRFADNHGLVGYDFDSINGFWGAQGLLYYMVPRLLNNPDLTVNDVIDEYVSAFGDAAPAVNRYIAYWEHWSYGLKERLNRKQSVMALPRIVTDEQIADAWHILNKAKKLASKDRPIIQKRVQFLRDGLRYMVLTRKVVKLGYVTTRPQGTTKAQFAKLADKLKKMRDEMTTKNVVWGPVIKWINQTYKLPVTMKWATSGSYMAGPFKGKKDPTLIKIQFSDWKFKKDPKLLGVTGQWYKHPEIAKSWQSIQVPSPWVLTWVGKYLDNGWYQTTFQIPKKYKGKTITLHFAGVDTEGWIYVNGKLVGVKSVKSTGKTPGEIWNKPINAKIPPSLLHWDAPNVLFVRVDTPPSGQAGIFLPVTAHVYKNN